MKRRATQLEAVLQRSDAARKRTSEPHITQNRSLVRRLVMAGPCGLAIAAAAIVSTRGRVSARYFAGIAVSDHANGQIESDLRDALGGQPPAFSTISVRLMDRMRAVAHLTTDGELRRAVRASDGCDAIARFDIAWYLAHHAVYSAIFAREHPVGVLIVNDLSIERIAMLSAAARMKVPIGLSLMDGPVKRQPPVRPDVVFAWDAWQGEILSDSQILVRPAPEIDRPLACRGSLRVLILASAFETPEELYRLADEVVSADAGAAVAVRTHPRVPVFKPLSDAVGRVVAGSAEPLTVSLSQADVVLGGESSSLFQAHRWGWPTARVHSEDLGYESDEEPTSADIPLLRRPIGGGDLQRLAGLARSRTIASSDQRKLWRCGWDEFLRGAVVEADGLLSQSSHESTA